MNKAARAQGGGHLDLASVGEIIQMALSDHIGFNQIRAIYGLSPDEVKVLMRTNLAPGSYQAWRRRVRRFADQREFYK
jgi:hypothetical protein